MRRTLDWRGKRALSDLATQHQRTFAYHLPWPGLGYIRRLAAGCEWVAEAYATPP